MQHRTPPLFANIFFRALSGLIDLQFVESEKLFLVWYLLFYHHRGAWSEHHEEKCVELKAGIMCCLADKTLKSLLKELYERGIVTCINVWHGESDLELKIARGIKPERPFAGVFCQQSFSGDDFGEPLYDYAFALQINEDEAEKFIATYLSKWLTGNIYQSGSYRILNPERQVEAVVQSIHNQIRDHSHRDFLLPVTAEAEAKSALDFVATVLFLHRIGDVDVLGFFYTEDYDVYSPQKEPIHFRLSLTNKFFRDFFLDSVMGELRFDLESLSSKEQKQN